ncbi:hypothetical protein EUGRSUZ_E02760 [Eucalyptus grandis]|uniref:Uncharacterized protein n=2 Tax=Eucalyptus grandis TaxID=71139 RepID=A0A059C857_EUCGR|nr:hypothetical protein EUGRSUZ_E02760 [Eucalyptus grandis]
MTIRKCNHDGPASVCVSGKSTKTLKRKKPHGRRERERRKRRVRRVRHRRTDARNRNRKIRTKLPEIPVTRLKCR